MRRSWPARLGVAVLELGLMVLVTGTVLEATPVIEPEPVEMTAVVGEPVTTVGTVNLYGSEPNTFVGLLVPAKEDLALVERPPRIVRVTRETLFRLEGDLLDELTALQGRRVIVTGVVVEARTVRMPPPVIRVESYELE